MLSMIVFSLIISESAKAGTIDGELYKYEGDSGEYELNSYTSKEAISSANSMGGGRLQINGSSEVRHDEITSFIVSGDSLEFYYSYEPSSINRDDTDWFVVDDKTKKVNGTTIKKNIDSGAVLVWASYDNTNWVLDTVYYDVFDTNSSFNKSFYNTKELQLSNGCFYRVMICYEMKRKVNSSQFLFIDTSEYEYEKRAEVYEFYAISKDGFEGNCPSVNDSPRKNLGKTTKVKFDSGYYDEQTMDVNDPHYGWEIGQFWINGYSSEVTNNGEVVFLKNVGDKVSLWFQLKQNIEKLNDNSALFIEDDTNGYDKYFQTPKTDFGHGALIIQFTDYEGVKHDPIIYTDFLSASAAVGANTRVQLFEEGDYEVSLDYEIGKNNINVGAVSTAPSYTNYKVTFKFSIRNGNCMVFPFDVVNGNELQDKGLTKNGFKLDLAKSRYLTIDVTRSVLIDDSNGGKKEDVRFNRPAKDGDQYTDEGIYRIKVTNNYTNETVEKVLYVGEDDYIKALSKNGCTLSDLNNMLAQGYEIAYDGSLVAPETEEDDVIVAEAEQEEPIDDSEPETQENESNTEEMTDVDDTDTIEEVITTEENTEEKDSIQKEDKNNILIVIVIVLLVVVAVGIGGVMFYLIKIKKLFNKNK